MKNNPLLNIQEGVSYYRCIIYRVRLRNSSHEQGISNHFTQDLCWVDNKIHKM